MNPDKYPTHIRELSGPQPLHPVMNIDSKLHTRNCDGGIVLFKSQPTAQIMGGPEGLQPTTQGPLNAGVAHAP